MSAEPAEGDVLAGRVRLEKRLGSGGYSSVWRATDLPTQSEVAVKILHADHDDAGAVARFQQEAEILARLEHGSIARAFNLGHSADRHFFTLEYVPGQTLQTRLSSRSDLGRPIPLSGVAWLVNGIASALAYAHAHGVVHRDLKPSNVMVNAPRDRPYVKILDFGAAKALEGAKFDPTTVGRVIGSIAYMAPEQLRSKPIDGRTDQFALAVMIYEMLTLHRTWAWDEDSSQLAFHRPIGDTNSQLDIMVRIVRGERPRVRDFRPEVPAAIDDVLQRALAPQAAERFATMTDFREAVELAMLDRGNVEPYSPSTAPAWADDEAIIQSGAFDDAAPTKAPLLEETITGELGAVEPSTTADLPVLDDDGSPTVPPPSPAKRAIQAAETAAAGPSARDMEATVDDIGEAALDETLESLDPGHESGELRAVRHDETKDHVDLLSSLDAVDPPRVRSLTLAHYGANADQEQFVWSVDESIVLGRDPGDGGAELLDPGSSRRHAEIFYDKKADAYHVRDLGSRNGTYVDGSRISDVELHHGAVIRIADSMFVYADVALPEGLPRPTLEPEVAPARAVIEARADLGARTELAVLILGPTGSGKEVMARRVHEGSGRSGKLIAVNCGSLNRELIASELFGHVAGAYSGANTDRSGLFVAADGGTLFLDEIADLPLDQQPSLLRTLQEKRVRPVGSDREVPVDVRVIAATHKPIDDLVESETFRRDLHARLSGFVLALPGLADRREEILPFFCDLSGLAPEDIAPDTAEALLLYDWPQNVRGVQHLAAQVKMYPRDGQLELTALPTHFSDNVTQRRKSQPKLDVDPDKLGKDGLEALLREHKGNVATIAKAFGKHRAQVYRWLKREGLDPDKYRSTDEE